MENLLQEPIDDTNTNKRSDRGDNNYLDRLSREASFPVKDRQTGYDPASENIKLVQKGFPDITVEEVTADSPNAGDVLKEIKELELYARQGNILNPEDLKTVLNKANSKWKLGPDEAIDGSDEGKEYLKTMDYLFNRFDFKTQFDFLKNMSQKSADSGFLEQTIDHLFAKTAYEIGFDHKSLNNPGPQRQEYGKAIVDIWLGLPEARQQRILAAMAAKRS